MGYESKTSSEPVPNTAADAGRILADARSQLPFEQGLLKVKDLAPRLQKCPRTIDQWRRRGLIPSIRIGSSVLFYWPDVLDALRQNFTLPGPRI